MSTEAPTPTPTPEQAPLSTQDSALSTGSKTSPKATSRSRLNAFKHGLTAQQFVFSPEEAEAYKAQADQIHKHYEPHGPVEEALVRQIADGIWRLDRASAMEHSIFANAINPDSETEDDGLALGRTWLAEGKSLTLLTLYVKRIENKLNANKAELALAQKTRKEEADKAMNEALLLHRAAGFEGKPYQPELHFSRPPATKDSVFSVDLVAAEDVRRHAYKQATMNAGRTSAPLNFPRRDAA